MSWRKRLRNAANDGMKGMTDPRQTEAPSKIHDDDKQVESALEEIQHFRNRADTPPSLSTLDFNLKRAEQHLRDVVAGKNHREADEPVSEDSILLIDGVKYVIDRGSRVRVVFKHRAGTEAIREVDEMVGERGVMGSTQEHLPSAEYPKERFE